MRGGRGDQNSKKYLKIYKVVKQQTNIKMYLFRVILTCDRRYNTYKMKKKIKHYIEDLIFKNFNDKKKIFKKF